MGNFTKLKFLDLNNNQIEWLDPSIIQQFPNLEALFINSNKIIDIQNNICKMNSLENVNDYNFLT